jgi:hypothetical protein
VPQWIRCTTSHRAFIDATHNLYGVSLEITGCTSAIAGIAFTGLGYLDGSNPTALHFIEGLSGPDPANPGGTVLISEHISPSRSPKHLPPS